MSQEGGESATKSPEKTKIKSEKIDKHTSLDMKNMKLYIGAHVSAAGGAFNSISNSKKIEGNAFALFLKSQRRWDNPPLTEDHIRKFKNAILKEKFDSTKIIPHGSYLINIGNPDEEKRGKSLENMLDDVQRCQKLGISFYNFHPGSTVGACSIEKCISLISQGINEILQKTEGVTILLENMAGQGNVIGSKFEELASIIDMIRDKSRIGVCLDTCHLFAAGYDIRTEESFKHTFNEFDRIVGLKYLFAFHLNDSKGELGEGKDRHENIGQGKLGIEAFKLLVNEERFKGIPMILETPFTNDEGYKREIKLLRSL